MPRGEGLGGGESLSSLEVSGADRAAAAALHSQEVSSRGVWDDAGDVQRRLGQLLALVSAWGYVSRFMHVLPELFEESGGAGGGAMT